MNITRGKIPHAIKLCVYGVEGIGKTTFCSKFPDPVFIDTENGTHEIDVARFDPPSSWQMLLEQVDYVIKNPETCKTLVIDSADWAERLCIEKVLANHHKTGLEDFGYGSGYRYVYEEFGKLLNNLSNVIERGINVVFTAHCALRKFEQPEETGSYDRWAMKLIDTPKTSIAAMLREYVDVLLFANYKTHTVSVDKDGKKKKAMGAGQRVMYTTHHSCWDAKNRYGMPDELPFDFSEIASIFEGSQEAKPTKAAKSRKKETAPPPSNMTARDEEEVLSKSQGEAPPEVPPADGPVAGDDDPLNIPDKMHREVDPDPRIPKELRDLMVHGNINEQDIQNIVSKKGYFPSDMPVTEYPEDFIREWLIPCWEDVRKAIIRSYEEIPFN